VRDALEVDQVFDAISYLKGSSVIRMLSSHLSIETFLDGVARYLKAHAYSNATTNDLWSALSEASGQDVKAFMDPWILRIGFPVLVVADEPGQISVQQRRFLLSGDVKAEEDETTWWIPLGLQIGDNTGILTTKEDTIRHTDDLYKLNKDQTGFYRVNYPPQHLIKLGESRAQLSVEDRAGLVGDAVALAKSGDGTTAGFLALVQGFQDEQNYQVWNQISMALGDIRSIFSDIEDVREGLKAFTRTLVTPAVERIGWEYHDSEDFLTSQLRSLLISSAGLAGHEQVQAEARKRFEAYMAGDAAAIHPNLRAAVFRIAIISGTEKEYEAVKKEYMNTTTIDGKELCLQCMGRVQQPDLVKDYISFLFSPRVNVGDVHYGAASLAANSKGRHLLWNHVKENWEDLRARLSGNMVVLERFLRMGLGKFADEDVRRDIEAFFEGKDCRGFDRGLGVVNDTIRGNAKYRERDEGTVREWLGAKGYM